jgi:hypothetical protein
MTGLHIKQNHKGKTGFEDEYVPPSDHDRALESSLFFAINNYAVLIVSIFDGRRTFNVASFLYR